MDDVEVAVAAGEAGARVVREMYGGPLERFGKTGTDFATDADLAAETAILEVIRDARPDDAVVGEETGAHGSNERTWLVDPLCGTLNYAARTPLVAVNVALRTAGGVTAAVSVDPFTDETFWTDGRSAYLTHDGVDEGLTPYEGSGLVDVNLDPPFPNGDTFRAVKMLADPEFESRFRPRVTSTTLTLAWVAAGRRAAYVTDGHLDGSVHFTSGIALCQAAGCVVTDLRGEPVHSGMGGLIAAADEATHTALLAVIGSV